MGQRERPKTQIRSSVRDAAKRVFNGVNDLVDDNFRELVRVLRNMRHLLPPHVHFSLVSCCFLVLVVETNVLVVHDTAVPDILVG